MKRILYIIMIIFALIVLVGFIKFNILDDDIYVENAQGKWIPINK